LQHHKSFDQVIKNECQNGEEVYIFQLSQAGQILEGRKEK